VKEEVPEFVILVLLKAPVVIGLVPPLYPPLFTTPALNVGTPVKVEVEPTLSVVPILALPVIAAEASVVVPAVILPPTVADAKLPPLLVILPVVFRFCAPLVSITIPEASGKLIFCVIVAKLLKLLRTGAVELPLLRLSVPSTIKTEFGLRIGSKAVGFAVTTNGDVGFVTLVGLGFQINGTVPAPEGF
jgi:hypothetical protein